tara:strand:- start:2 stop:328 length:327 start_codon:yes stop_codon:yes gene_type:complete
MGRKSQISTAHYEPTGELDFSFLSFHSQLETLRRLFTSQKWVACIGGILDILLFPFTATALTDFMDREHEVDEGEWIECIAWNYGRRYGLAPALLSSSDSTFSFSQKL